MRRVLCVLAPLCVSRDASDSSPLSCYCLFLASPNRPLRLLRRRQYLTSRGPHAFYELGFFTSRDGGKDDVVVEEGTGSRCVFKRV